ncbi:MAG: DUF6495 family protein [Flavobacteriaceae bacterium]|nr:DUF6495 family protein [Flavobacteriaceae bacterium]
MKYTRLTKEQFEELNLEFARFLASQSITEDEWEKIKREKPEIADEELDVFSDLIWEGSLSKVTYLENWSENQVYLFFFGESQIALIALKTTNKNIDFTTQKGIDWLEKNIGEDTVEIYEGTKEYTLEKNLEIFNFIKQGAIISKGEFYKNLKELL